MESANLCIKQMAACRPFLSPLFAVSFNYNSLGHGSRNGPKERGARGVYVCVWVGVGVGVGGGAIGARGVWSAELGALGENN